MTDTQVCALRVGAETYVIDIKRVEEILSVPHLTTMPGAPRFLKGLVRLRGDIVPVVDVRDRLGVESLVPKGKERLIVCRIGRRRVGLIVDRVTHVLRIARESIKPAPLNAGPGVTPYVLGVCGEPPTLKLLLDVKALLDETVLQ